MEISSIKKSIPNILTIIRIILIIPIIVLFLIDNINLIGPISNFFNWELSLNRLLIIIFFVIACVTDWLDGFISRKYNYITDFGKILDPIADKIIINSIFILLAMKNMTHVVFVILFIFRDIIVDAMRMNASIKQIVIPANFMGKLKTVLQMIAIIVLLFFGFKSEIKPAWIYWGIQQLLIYLSLSISISSGIIYIIDYIKQSKFIKVI